MEDKVNLLDKIINIVTGYMNDPKKSFVFGGIFFLGLFYIIIHIPAVENYKNMLATSYKDIEFWKKKNENTEKFYIAELNKERDHSKTIQDEALNNIIKTNTFLKDLKNDKADKVDYQKQVVNYQKQIMN